MKIVFSYLFQLKGHNGVNGVPVRKTEPGLRFAHLPIAALLRWRLRSVRQELPQVSIYSSITVLKVLLVDGSWGAWSSWTSCTTTCDWGMRKRQRSCTPPQQGGEPCIGESTQTEDCRATNCPGVLDFCSFKL